MLDPRGRQLLLSALRPPEGFSFDCAVGTTYSLDLIALLTTPLAFAMFDWQDDQGRLAADPALATADPLALLESLRRCADRIHLYCQAGQIKVPPANQRLLTYLEQSVIEVQAPAARDGRQAAFHPKVWALRFTGPEGAVRYRLLCLSRNLTFDRSWDTVLTLDGELTSRQNAYRENRPLGEFFAGLPGLAIRPEALGDAARKDTARIAEELRVVDWELPQSVKEVRFWPMGMSGRETWPFGDRLDRLLVISPFITEGFLSRIAGESGEAFLVSRIESLREIAPGVLAGAWTCFTLDESVDTDPVGEESPPGDEPTPASELTGLHAKMYIADAGWDAHVWTGSANATTAAFSGNVEFLVELIGPKSVFGIDAAIGEQSGKAEAGNLRSMLAGFTPSAEAFVPDPDVKKAEALVDAGQRAMYAIPMEVRLSRGDDAEAGFLSSIVSLAPVTLPEGVSASCRPIMLPAADAKSIAPGSPMSLQFGPHARESISSFVCFSLAATVGGASMKSEFVLNLPLLGAPADRKERLLRDLLKDSRTLLRFLMLLLSDDPESLFADLGKLVVETGATGTAHSDDLLPLLEHMLRALHRSPDKLDQVDRLVEDLRKTPEGRSILPADLERVWEPIRQVRAGMASADKGGAR